jgi:DNA adenine methylase
MTTRKAKPILRWPGGKTRLLPEILPLIKPHVCYGEPFAGGLAVLIAKEPSPREVVNDKNGEVINLYHQVKFHLPELEREIEWILNSRKSLFDFMAQPGLTEIQRAGRWLMRNKISFAGGMTSFGVSKTSSGGACVSRFGLMEAMEALNKRIDRVTFENVDWEHFVRLYDSEDTFFFIDPPYLNAKIKNYAGWTEEQMRGLRKVLDKVKANWVLTVDASDFNRELFGDFKLRRVTSANQATNRRTHAASKFSEFIITPQ